MSTKPGAALPYTNSLIGEGRMKLIAIPTTKRANSAFISHPHHVLGNKTMPAIGPKANTNAVTKV